MSPVNCEASPGREREYRGVAKRMRTVTAKARGRAGEARMVSQMIDLMWLNKSTVMSVGTDLVLGKGESPSGRRMQSLVRCASKMESDGLKRTPQSRCCSLLRLQRDACDRMESNQ